MSIKFTAALLLACGCWVSPALADEQSDDIKCLAASIELSGSQDPDDQSIGMLSTMFWLGRLDGRDPSLDLEKQMAAGAFDMKDTDRKAEAARCATLLKTRGEELTRLGEQLRRRQNSN
jgi:hypothetical protein